MIVRNLLIQIGFKTNPAPIRKAGREVDRLKQKASRLKQTLKGVNTALLRMASGYLGLMGVMTLGRGLVRTIATFETLHARLKSVTGSIESAAEAFAMLREFAKNTPFQLEEITEAFISMKLRGLDTSMEALTKMGDLASFRGMTMKDMMLVVTQAISRQHDGLRRLGVEASFQGNKIHLTFEGVKQTIDNNALAIQNYLNAMSDKKATGAMALQMGTINGIVSNLTDSLAEFAYEMGEAGLLDAIREFLQMLGESDGAGESLAQTFGRVLAGAVRAFTQVVRVAIRYVRDGIEVFKLLFGWVDSILLGIGFLDDRFTNMGDRWKALGYSILRPFVLLEDMIAYLQGRPSVIGMMVQAGDEDQLGWLQRQIVELRTLVGADGQELEGGTKLWWEDMSEGLGGLQEMLSREIGATVALFDELADAMSFLWDEQMLPVALYAIVDAFTEMSRQSELFVDQLIEGRFIEAIVTLGEVVLSLMNNIMSAITNSINAAVNAMVAGFMAVVPDALLDGDYEPLPTDVDFGDEMSKAWERDFGDGAQNPPAGSRESVNVLRGTPLAAYKSRIEGEATQVYQQLHQAVAPQGPFRSPVKAGTDVNQQNEFHYTINITGGSGSPEEISAAVTSAIGGSNRHTTQELETANAGMVR